MKMVVVTTITSTLDIESMESSHVAKVDDQDGLSEVSGDVLGAIIIGGLHATKAALIQQFPRLDAADKRTNQPITDDEEEL